MKRKQVAIATLVVASALVAQQVEAASSPLKQALTLTKQLKQQLTYNESIDGATLQQLQVAIQQLRGKAPKDVVATYERAVRQHRLQQQLVALQKNVAQLTALVTYGQWSVTKAEQMARQVKQIPSTLVKDAKGKALLTEATQLVAAKETIGQLVALQSVPVTLQRMAQEQALIRQLSSTVRPFLQPVITKLQQQPLIVTESLTATETIHHDVIIVAGVGEAVTVANATMTGHVTIKGENGRGGTVTLQRVTAPHIVIEEVDEHSLHLEYVKTDRLTVRDENGARIVAEVGNDIGTLQLEQSVELISAQRDAFRQVAINGERTSVTLSGDFTATSFTVQAQLAALSLQKGTKVKDITVQGETKIVADRNATIERVVVDKAKVVIDATVTEVKLLSKEAQLVTAQTAVIGNLPPVQQVVIPTIVTIEPLRIAQGGLLPSVVTAQWSNGTKTTEQVTWSPISTAKIGTYTTSVRVNGTSHLVKLIVEDRRAPEVTLGEAEYTVPFGAKVELNVTVTDENNETATLHLDDAAINYTKAGTYEATVYATDKAGNASTKKTITVHVAPRNDTVYNELVAKAKRLSEQEYDKSDWQALLTLLTVSETMSQQQVNQRVEQLTTYMNKLVRTHDKWFAHVQAGGTLTVDQWQALTSATIIARNVPYYEAAARKLTALTELQSMIATVNREREEVERTDALIAEVTALPEVTDVANLVKIVDLQQRVDALINSEQKRKLIERLNEEQTALQLAARLMNVVAHEQTVAQLAVDIVPYKAKLVHYLPFLTEAQQQLIRNKVEKELASFLAAPSRSQAATLQQLIAQLTTGQERYTEQMAQAVAQLTATTTELTAALQAKEAAIGDEDYEVQSLAAYRLVLTEAKVKLTNGELAAMNEALRQVNALQRVMTKVEFIIEQLNQQQGTLALWEMTGAKRINAAHLASYNAALPVGKTVVDVQQLIDRVNEEIDVAEALAKWTNGQLAVDEGESATNEAKLAAVRAYFLQAKDVVVTVAHDGIVTVTKGKTTKEAKGQWTFVDFNTTDELTKAEALVQTYEQQLQSLNGDVSAQREAATRYVQQLVADEIVMKRLAKAEAKYNERDTVLQLMREWYEAKDNQRGELGLSIWQRLANLRVEQHFTVNDEWRQLKETSEQWLAFKQQTALWEDYAAFEKLYATNQFVQWAPAWETLRPRVMDDERARYFMNVYRYEYMYTQKKAFNEEIIQRYNEYVNKPIGSTWPAHYREAVEYVDYLLRSEQGNYLLPNTVTAQTVQWLTVVYQLEAHYPINFKSLTLDELTKESRFWEQMLAQHRNHFAPELQSFIQQQLLERWIQLIAAAESQRRGETILSLLAAPLMPFTSVATPEQLPFITHIQELGEQLQQFKRTNAELLAEYAEFEQTYWKQFGYPTWGPKWDRLASQFSTVDQSIARFFIEINLYSDDAKWKKQKAEHMAGVFRNIVKPLIPLVWDREFLPAYDGVLNATVHREDYFFSDEEVELVRQRYYAVMVLRNYHPTVLSAYTNEELHNNVDTLKRILTQCGNQMSEELKQEFIRYIDKAENVTP